MSTSKPYFCFKCKLPLKDHKTLLGAPGGVECPVLQSSERPLVISSLINCNAGTECPGCLNGTVMLDKGLINFKCNECGHEAGYIDMKQFKKLKIK